MGREIRKVPPNWSHPKQSDGQYIPLHDKTFKEAAAEWKKGFFAWERGERPEYCSGDSRNEEYWQWDGNPPDPESYRPEYTAEPTWFQVYETVSEGTPCSPPFATEEELIVYLMTEGGIERKRYPNIFPLLTREQAEKFVLRDKCAASLVVDSKGIRSGLQI